MDKRLLFCLTPGRSGTRYLAAVLDTLEGVTARHEPEPSLRWLMRAVQRAPLTRARQFWEREKLPAIQVEPGAVYVETSHLFGKGFLEPLLSLEVAFEVILLRRAARAVALSLWRRNTIPGRTINGWRSLLYPEDRVAIGVVNWQALSDYQLCYWYAREIEERQRYYQAELEDVPVWELDFEDLIDGPDGLIAFCARVGLPPPVLFKLAGLAGTDAQNATPDEHKARLPDGDLEDMEAPFRRPILPLELERTIHAG